jgi:hypothetical protein
MDVSRKENLRTRRRPPRCCATVVARSALTTWSRSRPWPAGPHQQESPTRFPSLRIRSGVVQEGPRPGPPVLRDVRRTSPDVDERDYEVTGSAVGSGWRIYSQIT